MGWLGRIRAVRSATLPARYPADGLAALKAQRRNCHCVCCAHTAHILAASRAGELQIGWLSLSCMATASHWMLRTARAPAAQLARQWATGAAA